MQLKTCLLLLLINTGLCQNDSSDLKGRELKEEMAVMKASLNNLISNYNAMAKSLTKVIADNTVMEKSLTKIISNNKDLQMKNQKLEERVNHLSLSPAKKTDIDSFVTFTAYASVIRSYEVGETMIFDQQVVNYGGHFNPVSSIFTCPVSGYYLFHASLLSYYSQLIDSRIYVDDTFIIGAHCDGGSSDYGTGSMLIVARCDEGSSVSVKIEYAGEMYGSEDRQTMFTGTLLTCIDPDCVNKLY